MAGDIYQGPTASQRGSYNTQNNFYGQEHRAPALWPHQVGVIPSRAGSYQVRVEALRSRSAVASGSTVVLGQVLTGMGGVGKTQLAAEYARAAWSADEIDVLVWITATDRASVVARYAQAAAEVLGADPADPERAAAAFLAWLEPKPRQGACRWLVVLDDIADPADLDGLWPPACSDGWTLATTRRQDAALAGPGRHMLTVGLFSPAEAVAYLTDALAACGHTEPDGDLAALVADLGHLPLALSQAAAYLTDAGISCGDYRTLLVRRTSSLADTAPDRLPDGQTHAVAAAWDLSIEAADRLRPAGLARPMLHLAVFLDPNGIPSAVLTSPPALAYLTRYRTRLDGGPQADQATSLGVTAEEATAALRALRRLSLIGHTHNTPHQIVRIHALIQRAIRDTLTTEQRHDVARTAADALYATWPVVERDTGLAQALRANTAVLTAVAEDALYTPAAHQVLFRTGTSLGEAGQITASNDHHHHMIAATRERFGPDHFDTLTARHNLIRWQSEAGDAAGAAAAFEVLVTDYVRVLGSDHFETLKVGHNLAHWRGKAGDATGAAAAFDVLLADCLRVLGPDHPHTLTARQGLATWRAEAGDIAGATPAYEALLVDRIRVLGPDHPDTLSTRYNVDHLRGEVGDPAGAVTAFKALLVDRNRVLGPNHPDTLSTRGRLAYWQAQAGDVAGAASAYEALLVDQIRVLGPDHPDTLSTRANLARRRGEAEDVAGAASAYEALLVDRIRVLGPDHPDTLAAGFLLAYWRAELGGAADAVTAFEALLSDYIRVLGPDHPHTDYTRLLLDGYRRKARNAAAGQQ
ncbi:tetratricopeptide repeat protein [Streptomyces sp. NBC_01613]|uniref:tetratricopeptide repeat protein n=1 Tax=Streptomyces sp. NBC_01613 TaxID=2975896 RepID=UPI003863B34A